jgi:hypothetical protein
MNEKSERLSQGLAGIEAKLACHDRQRSALMRLANEVRATMSLAEHAVREAAGNTNYQCLMDAESEARVALGVIHQQQPQPEKSK